MHHCVLIVFHILSTFKDAILIGFELNSAEATETLEPSPVPANCRNRNFVITISANLFIICHKRNFSFIFRMPTNVWGASVVGCIAPRENQRCAELRCVCYPQQQSRLFSMRKSRRSVRLRLQRHSRHRLLTQDPAPLTWPL